MRKGNYKFIVSRSGPLLVSARIVVSIYGRNWIRTGGGPISISMIQNQNLN